MSIPPLRPGTAPPLTPGPAGPLTLGTAGHVDHGKTALVRALTGTDTDRLAAERERGISIELGYAALALASGRRLSVIDVPGHDRYVRTMVAGATGIDLFLMVVAADDGVMAQTHEHAAVLAALGITRGVIAITKCDIADPAPARAQVGELLPGTPAVAVSSRTGEGVDELRAAVDAVADTAPARGGADRAARLHIDRVFTIRGAGTVVTGTLWSGAIARGDELTLLPSGTRVRVRGVQVHDEAVAHAAAGQRVAVNLAGVKASGVSRGDVLSGDPALGATYRLDAQLELSDEDPRRVGVHHGTRETAARPTWLGGRFWQLRLEQPLIAAAGDRVVVRQIAPPGTLGGGIVLDAHPRRHGPSRDTTQRLVRLARGNAADPLPAPSPPGPSPPPSSTPPPSLPPPSPPPPSRPPPNPPSPSLPGLSPSALATEERLRCAGFSPPGDTELDAQDLAALRAAGRAIRVSPHLHFHPDALAEAQRRVVALAGGPGGAVTLAQVRDALCESRRFAAALLSHLDSTRVTVRRGDEHVVRRRGPV